MSGSDIKQIEAIKEQTLKHIEHIAELTASQRTCKWHHYDMAGWDAFVKQLQQTVDWCNEKLPPITVSTARTLC